MARKRAQTDWEEVLASQLRAVKIWHVREYRAIPGRNFRFDFMCSPNEATGIQPCVLVEVHGGQWAQQNGKRSAHVGGYGMARDCEKASLAAVHGFRLVPVTPAQVKSGQALLWIEGALGIAPAGRRPAASRPGASPRRSPA